MQWSFSTELLLPHVGIHSPSCLLLLSIWLKSSELSRIENLFQSGWSIKSNYYILLRRYKKEIPVLLLCFTHKCLSQSLYHFNSYRLKRMCEEFGTAEHLFHNQVFNYTDLQNAICLYHDTTVITDERKSCPVCAVSEAHCDWTEKILICYKCSTYIESKEIIGKCSVNKHNNVP